MSKKFASKLLVIAILSICSSVVNASSYNTNMNSINNDNIMNNSKPMEEVDSKNNNLKNVSKNNSDDETNFNSEKNSNSSNRNSKNNSPETKKQDVLSKLNNNQIEEIDLYNMKNNCKTNSKNTINENNIVHYEPDKMWFDYQALFDKTKNIILGKENDSDNIEIKHTDFMENDLARSIVFDSCDSDDYNKEFLRSVINGNIVSQYFIFNRCHNFLENYSRNNSTSSFSNKQKSLVELNYKYFIGIIFSLGNGREYMIDDYKKFTNGCVPASLKNPILQDISFVEVMSPMFKKVFYKK